MTTSLLELHQPYRYLEPLTPKTPVSPEGLSDSPLPMMLSRSPSYNPHEDESPDEEKFYRPFSPTSLSPNYQATSPERGLLWGEPDLVMNDAIVNTETQAEELTTLPEGYEENCFDEASDAQRQALAKEIVRLYGLPLI
jgi:hypothetical protein